MSANYTNEAIETAKHNGRIVAASVHRAVTFRHCQLVLEDQNLDQANAIREAFNDAYAEEVRLIGTPSKHTEATMAELTKYGNGVDY